MDLGVVRLQLGELLQHGGCAVDVVALGEDRGQQAQALGGGSAQPVALGVGPLGVGLVGEEVPAVELERLRQLGLGIRGGAAACCVDPLLRRLLELVGVDLHPPPVDRVPALDGGDERRGRALRPVGLELVAQCVDEVADVVQRGRPRTRPERLGDLLGVDHAVALADEVLEDVSRPLLEPLAAERPLGAVHVHPAEGGDPQPRPADPVRVATPAPVAGVAGAKVEQRAAIAERGGGHPQRAHAAGTARVDPDLRAARPRPARRARRGNPPHTARPAPCSRRARRTGAAASPSRSGR